MPNYSYMKEGDTYDSSSLDFRKGLREGPLFVGCASIGLSSVIRKMREPAGEDRITDNEAKGIFYSGAATLFVEAATYIPFGFLKGLEKINGEEPVAGSLLLFSPLLIQVPDALYELIIRPTYIKVKKHFQERGYSSRKPLSHKRWDK